MKNKIRFRSIFIPILSLSLLLSPIVNLGNVVKADEEQTAPVTVPKFISQPAKDVSFLSSHHAKEELPQYRTANSKRFLNPDGSFTEAIYSEPVHYKDPITNQWQDIDSELVKAADGSYHNKANRFSVSLQPNANGGLFTFTDNGASVSFSPQFADSINGNAIGHKIEYNNVTTDTDLSYEVTPTGLKESLVLKSANSPTVYSYKLNTSLTAQVQKDGSIQFFKTGSKTPLFSLEKPYMEDDKHQKSTAVSYQIQKDSTNQTILQVTADQKWLHDAKRSYPVLLDPTFTENSANDTSAEPYSGEPDTNFGSNPNGNTGSISIGNTWVGGVTRTLHWFQLPLLPTGSTVTSATFNVTNSAVVDSATSPVIEAHRITSDWNANTVTWNTIPTAAGVDGQTGSAESTIHATNTTTPSTWSFDVSKLAQDWYNGKQANYGIELKFADESQEYRDIYPSNFSPNTSQSPNLMINYKVDGFGQQSFWTFNGPVNMANENLALSSNDITFTGRHSELKVNRTYNSRNTATGEFGNNWSSVLDSLLIMLPKSPARYVDANGTVYYFSYNAANDTYTSPSGLYWTLTKSGNTATITTRDQIKYTFTDLSNSTFTNGQLTQVMDMNNNKTTYSYSPSQVTIADDAGHKITLAISGNLIQSATDPAGRIWKYEYTGNNLTSVTNPLNQTVQYRYDSSNRLTATVSPANKVTYYVYPTNPSDPAFRNVIAINPTNMVTNGSFEVDSGGTVLPDHWYFSGGIDGKASIASTSGIQVSPTGHSLSISTNSSYSIYVSEKVPVDPSKNYVLSGYLMGTQTSGTQATVLSLLPYDSSGNPLPETARSAPSGTFSWKPYVFKIPAGTLPAGTASVYVKVATSNSSGTGSSSFDGIQLEEGTDATDFVGGNQYTSDTASMKTAMYNGEGHKTLYTYNDAQNITQVQRDPLGVNLTDKFTWDTVNVTSHTDSNNHTWNYNYTDPNNSNNMGNLHQSTDPNGKTKIQTWDSTGKSELLQTTGELGNTSNYTYDNEDNNVAAHNMYNTSSGKAVDSNGNTIQTTSALGWSDNLLENSSFENGTNSDGTPVHFSIYTGQQATWSLDNSPVVGKNDLSIGADSTNPNNNTVLHSDPIPFDNTADLVLTGYLHGTQFSGNQETILSIDAFDSNNKDLGDVGNMDLQGVADWQRWATLIHPSDFPAGTSTLYVKLTARNTTGYGTSYFDAIQLQKNPVDTAYNLVDNSSFERGSSNVYDWLPSDSGNIGWTNDPSSVYAGTRSLYIAGATADTEIPYANYIPYDGSKTYTLTAMMKTTGLTSSVGSGLAGIKIEEYDSNKNKVGTDVWSTKLSGDNDWHLMTAQLPPAQTGSTVAYIRPALASGNSPGYAYFDNVRLVAASETTQYGYDATNTWTTKITDPIGNSTSYLLDPNGTGDIIQTTDAKGYVTKKTYDALDRLKTNTPPGNDVMTANEYDPDGNLSKITLEKPDGSVVYNATQFTYNSLNEESSLTDPLGNKTTFKYNSDGKLVESDAPTGKINYTYDSVNRMTDFTLSDNSGKKFDDYNYNVMDANGNRKLIKDTVLNHSWSASYDELNQLLTWADDNGSVAFTSDAAGHVTQRVVKNTSGSVSKTFAVTYNQNGDPITVTEPSSSKADTFLFNENDQLSSMMYANSDTQNTTFDDDGHVTKLQYRNSAGLVLSNYEYTYDANGFVKSMTGFTSTGNDSPNVNLNQNYTYTPKGQLETETLSSGNTVTYTYDPVGNMTSRVEKKPDNTVVKTTTYSYDTSYDELTKVDGSTYTYDHNGNTTSNGTYNFIWDSGNRLIEVDNASSGIWVAKYQYDYMNRRIQQNVNEQGITNYLYDGMSNHVLAEFDGNGNMTKYYTWSPTGVLLSFTVNVNTTPVTYYTTHDAHGNIMELTNSAGAVVASYSYDAWGNTTINSTGNSIALQNPYRYSDYRFDDTTGLYYLVGRYYDPTTGRFLSSDPTTNSPSYWYASNNPVMNVDPNGYRPLTLSDGAETPEEHQTSLEEAQPQRDNVPEEVTQTRISRVAQGNRVHYDQKNGGTGRQLPTKLQEQYKDTEFKFARRGQAGADVEVTGGVHPSDYEGSTWDPNTDFGDFKPNTKSGWKTFLRDIRKGKLPNNSEFLPYSTTTEDLVDKTDSVATPAPKTPADTIVKTPVVEDTIVEDVPVDLIIP